MPFILYLFMVCFKMSQKRDSKTCVHMCACMMIDEYFQPHESIVQLNKYSKS